MHRLLVPASPSQDCSVVAVWIAEAVDRGEKVLYKHAPSEDTAAVLGRSLSAVGLDPAVLMTGQVQLADADALRIETGGVHEALSALHEQQLDQANREGFAEGAGLFDALGVVDTTEGFIQGGDPPVIAGAFTSGLFVPKTRV